MKIGTIYDITFSTNRADTWALANADSTPIVRVTENGVNLAYTPTVSSLTTWVYLVTIDASLANGFEVGKRYSVYVTATVNSIDWANGLDSFTINTRSIDDVLPTASYTAPDNAGIALIPTNPLLANDSRLDYIDAPISWVWGGGLSIEEHDKLFSLENSTGGGGGFSSQAIQSSLQNVKKEIIEKIDEIKPTDLSNVEKKLNEIDSHNSLAKDEIINTIKETETEVCSDIVRSKKELKEDNVKTRELVRQKTKKLDENVSKLADRQDLTDKTIEDEANEIEASLEKIINDEADSIEKEKEAQIEKEIQEIESNQLTNGNNNGTEG